MPDTVREIVQLYLDQIDRLAGQDLRATDLAGAGAVSLS